MNNKYMNPHQVHYLFSDTEADTLIEEAQARLFPCFSVIFNRKMENLADFSPFFSPFCLAF